jgi:hypothetical protein
VKHRYGIVILGLVLLALPGPVAAATATAATRFGPEAVWTLPMAAWSACLEKTSDPTACLSRLMRDSGATASALAVARLLDGEGYMSAFRKTGRVNLATMTFPARANTNEVAYLVGGNPPLVSTELDAQTVNIAVDPAYPALRAAYPEMELWPSGAEFRSVDRLADGGQGFVFAYPLLNGCHACESAGHALMAHDFGPDGRYRGVRLLRLEPHR